MKKILSNLISWMRRFLSGSFYIRHSFWQTYPTLFAASVEPKYMVPGLKKAQTLNLANLPDSCSSMTPQGLTITEEFLLISAYCHQHQHHSVIYVLDRVTGTHIKTVCLPDLPHVGGLAYDSRYRKIWISNKAGENAAVATITLADIKNYDQREGKSIVYQQKFALKELPRASALTYDHGYLVVALFSLKQAGQIVCYPIDYSGSLAGATDLLATPIKTTTSLLESASGTLAIPPKIQGVTFYKNFLLLSRSWGKQPGKIFVFDIHKTTDFSDLGQAKQIIATPPYLEQIIVEGEQLFALFESGAAAYRKKTPLVMKEILQLNLNQLLND
ncbi:MAG: YncE family protein [Enterococcus viikkiensis]|uniref:Uncharacterized protein n=1 Tax=Enterococcus viikkiensis TaxID=930854 RepID=A0ABU3FLW0_9ENTE|nr:hypothetical protein [Enterococcus viikkiensis]MDT2826964.1 hypothetical protein [Enterococcus viikkiensis]